MSYLRVPLVALLLLRAAIAQGEEPKVDTPGRRAERVLAAVGAGDAAALRNLAESADPDPWLVADELVSRGEREAALAFAGATRGKDTEALPAYLESEEASAEQAPRAVLEEVVTRGRSRDAEGVLAVLAEADAGAGGVVSLRLREYEGWALHVLGRYRESSEVYRDIAQSAERIGWLRKAVGALHWSAVCAAKVPDLEAALARRRHQVALEEARGNRVGVAATLQRITEVFWSQKRWAEALPSAERALGLREQLGDPGGKAGALYNLGIVLAKMGRREEGIRRLEASLELRREVGDPAGIAASLHSIGYTRLEMEDFDGALEHLEEALAIRRKIGGRDRIANTLSTIGTVQDRLGNLTASLRLHEEALVLYREIGDRRLVATSLHNVGHVHQQLGNLAEALRCNEAALHTAREIGDRFGVASNLCYIGMVLKRLGNYDEALRCYDESHRIMRELGLPQGIVATLISLGDLHVTRGSLDEALECYEGALEVSREMGNLSNIAGAIHCIGIVHENRGDYEEALKYYEEGLKLETERGIDADMGTSVLAIADVHEKLGHYDEAQEAYERAYRLMKDSRARGHLASILGGLARLDLHREEPDQALARVSEGLALVAELSEGLAEGEGAGARDGYSRLFDVGYRAALAADDVVALARLLEQGRAGSLRESLGALAAREAAVVPEDLRRELEAARMAERRALMEYRDCFEGGELKAVRRSRQAWEVARAEVRRIARRIEREAKHAAAVTLAAPSDLDTIQGGLEPYEAFVYYALTSEEAIGLVVRRGGARIVALGASEDVETATDALLGGERPIDPAAVPALRNLLVSPLGLGEDVRRVLVSPMGRLGYVPFSLLFPDHEVAYVPSGTTYALLAEERSERGRKILALGDPDYQTRVDETALRIRAGNVTRLTPLPATRKEVEAVADVRFLGKQATETGLQHAVAARDRWRAVHFACHGLVDPDRPMLSALALTADGENDGFLTALEILRLRVPADLVVMSACETGRGRIYRTEGIVGLTRAFMCAGAPRVIGSLWKVDDEATRALMLKFYELWNPEEGEGLPAATALKQAQEFVRSHEKWHHPFYWAAWVLWGLPD